MGTWSHGHMGTLDLWTYDDMDICTCRLLDIWIDIQLSHEHMGTWAHGHMVTWAH
jgi:hypothetical protein